MDPVAANYLPNGMDYGQFLKDDIKEALATLYDYQSSLSLSPLTVSESQHKLFYDKSVSMYFRDSGGVPKILNFTINEAVLQTLGAIFTSKHFNVTDY